MGCKFAHLKLDDYQLCCACFMNWQNLIFVESVLMDFFITLVFMVMWFKEQLCLSWLMNNFKIGGI